MFIWLWIKRRRAAKAAKAQQASPQAAGSPAPPAPWQPSRAAARRAAARYPLALPTPPQTNVWMIGRGPVAHQPYLRVICRW